LAGCGLELRQDAAAEQRICDWGFNGRPSPHYMMAMLNRWLSSDSSRRTVLLLRGTSLPFSSGSPASRMSRYWATISALRAASEYLPRCLSSGWAFLTSDARVDSRLVGVTSRR